MKKSLTLLSYAKISRNEFKDLSHIKRRTILVCIRLEIVLKKVLDFLEKAVRVGA